MIQDIQSDVAAFAPLPQQVPWYKRLEDKLRRVYSILTCAGGADVAPHGPAPRPLRHSPLIRDAQVSPSRHSTGRQDPRPRHTVVQSPRPRPTYEHGSSSHQPDPSQSGPSQIHSHFCTSSQILPSLVVRRGSRHLCTGSGCRLRTGMACAWLPVRDVARLRDTSTSTSRVEPVCYADDSDSGPPR